jgi:hypothetical protein
MPAARRCPLLSASAFANAAFTCGHACALQRSASIRRRTRLMRSHGCQRRASMASASPDVGRPGAEGTWYRYVLPLERSSSCLLTVLVMSHGPGGANRAGPPRFRERILCYRKHFCQGGHACDRMTRGLCSRRGQAEETEKPDRRRPRQDARQEAQSGTSARDCAAGRGRPMGEAAKEGRNVARRNQPYCAGRSSFCCRTS